MDPLDKESGNCVHMLICDNNALTSFDASGDVSLGLFSCANNLLTTLDLTESTELTLIIATGNRFSSIKTVISGTPVNLTANGK